VATLLIGPGVAFAALLVVFALLERRFPGVRGQRLVRRGFWTDVVYWFVVAPVGRVAAVVASLAATVVAALLVGTSPDAASLRGWVERDTAVGRQPLAVQVLELVVLADLIGYCTHRLFHRRRLWPFHAVHHSSVELDWLSSVRVHPVNDVVTSFVQALPLLLLGFEVGTLGPLAVVLTVYSIFVHANLNWRFGSLRYVLVSPVFHRWHHTTEQAGLDRNFAGLLPVWDVVFGTFYLPDDREPTRFGVCGEALPDGPVGQLFYPFRLGAERSSGPG
jgi:sterol desaturase/sphingolipid hydroxylase (fatty acid hydroxylase superfamily)